MIAPVHRLRKKDIVWLSRNRCRHSHTYLEHYNCMLEEIPNGIRRIGFFDIETTSFGFKADSGIMIAYCIKDKNNRKIFGRTVTTKEVLSREKDKQIVKDCIDDIKKFDRLITFYGSRFDIPFLRTRAAVWNHEFPEFGEINQVDLYYTVRNKFCLYSNRLGHACEVILGKSNKTPFNYDIWLEASQGKKEALSHILVHCKYDVIDLEKLYNKIFPYRKDEDKSI